MKIPEFLHGDKERTALHTVAINQLVKGINAFFSLKISPEGAGSLKVAEDGGSAVLTIRQTPAAVAGNTFSFVGTVYDSETGTVSARLINANGTVGELYNPA